MGDALLNARERYIVALLFQKPDKYPFIPGGPRESTLKRWRSEGLPENTDWFDFLRDTINIPIERTYDPKIALPTLFGMNPSFEEKVLEHKNGHYLVQDIHGAIVEISDEYDVTYLRSAKDFVTRAWHKFPIETPTDWPDIKRRYNVEDPRRYPKEMTKTAKIFSQRNTPLVIAIPGPFWKLRDWIGFENLCMLMVENPNFVEEMTEFWKHFVLGILERYQRYITFDSVIINEDMAYKGKSMISPAMARRFLKPSWSAWTDLLKKSGCPVVMLDSDGYIGELIPLWIETGINACIPVEVAAGNDIVAFRKKFGKNIAYQGGIDKRAIAKGGKVIEKELFRVIPPFLEEGGFIPSCDHGVPHNISWESFVEYCRLLAQLTGWG